MNRPLVRWQVFGNDTKPTIYYFTGYGTTISLFSLHIRLLTMFGFRLVAFEYDKDVLIGGEPRLMTDAVKTINDFIAEDARSRSIAGAYGISLGSLFACNTLQLDVLHKVIFNTGGTDFVEAIWDIPVAGPSQLNFKKHGYSREDVDKAWEDINIAPPFEKFKGNEFLYMASRSDGVFFFDRVERTVSGLQQSGISAQLLASRRWRHGVSIVRNCLRVYRTVRFYRPARVDA